jgi:DNA-directed RNA polymerase subunit RPC12/RpoP
MHIEKELFCHICKRQFKRTENFFRHNESIHNALNVDCIHCDSKFKHKGLLNNHMISVHGKIK